MTFVAHLKKVFSDAQRAVVNAVTNAFHSFDSSNAVTAIATAIHSFGLTPEHIASVKAEVIAIKDAVNETGESLSGAAKAANVATKIGALAEDLKLPPAALDYIHLIISSVHAIAKLEGLV